MHCAVIFIAGCKDQLLHTSIPDHCALRGEVSHTI